MKLLLMSTTRPAIVLAVGLTVALPTAAWAQRSEPAAVTGTQVEDSGGSLLGDIGRDYRRFFTSRETVTILSVGIASSMSLRPFDGSIAGSRFNGELYQDTASTPPSRAARFWGAHCFKWAARSPPTASDARSVDPALRRWDATSSAPSCSRRESPKP